jgi:hypothetical protein
MLTIQPCSRLYELLDREGQIWGRIKVKEVRENLVLGQFFPEPKFSQIRPLFSEYEDAVNQMVFGVLDELEEAIDEQGLHLCATEEEGRLDLYDVQIMNENNISFRIKDHAPSSKPTT